MGITARISAERLYAPPLLAVAEDLAEEGLSHRVTCDSLPDMARYLLEMAQERSGFVTGEERVRLDAIVAKLEEILIELETIPCTTP